MQNQQPETIESATKALNHIQKVFYVVGGINFYLILRDLLQANKINILGLNLFTIFLLTGLIISIAILFMGWALKKTYRKSIPKAVFALGILLIALNAIEVIIFKNFNFIVGFILPIAFLIISKQAEKAVKKLEEINA